MAHLDFLHHVDLPEDVLVSWEDAGKAPPAPMPQPPRWLVRFLPGLEWSATADDSGGDDDEEGDDDDFDPEERTGVAFKAFEFSVTGGEGLGLVGPDFEVTQTLLFMLAGLFPPSSGRIVIRGRVAPQRSVDVGGHRDFPRGWQRRGANRRIQDQPIHYIASLQTEEPSA